MYNSESVLSEAQVANEKLWFVQAFIGEVTGLLYFPLIERNQRIYGIDRETDHWHLHPFEEPHKHELFLPGLGPTPLLAFMSKVEKVLVENNLL